MIFFEWSRILFKLGDSPLNQSIYKSVLELQARKIYVMCPLQTLTVYIAKWEGRHRKGPIVNFKSLGLLAWSEVNSVSKVKKKKMPRICYPYTHWIMVKHPMASPLKITKSFSSSNTRNNRLLKTIHQCLKSITEQGHQHGLLTIHSLTQFSSYWCTEMWIYSFVFIFWLLVLHWHIFHD